MKSIILIASVLSTLAFQLNDPVKGVKQEKSANTVNNLPPQANAGEDLTYSVKEFVQLDGTSSRELDGIISRYQWNQVSGPAVTIVNPQAAITAINGVAKGEYVFRLSVTDDKGSVATDEIRMTIKD